jgi:HlyD family secretion protein
VQTDSYPDKRYAGRVSYLSDSAEFTPKTVQTEEERTKLMYRVKIQLDNPKGELKPGMPADAVVRIDDPNGPIATTSRP